VQPAENDEVQGDHGQGPRAISARKRPAPLGACSMPSPSAVDARSYVHPQNPRRIKECVQTTGTVVGRLPKIR
jgi:hypothetical protein